MLVRLAFEKNTYKNFCHDQQRWGGGETILRFYGGTQLL